jgi:hypothetical protein
VKVQIGCEDIPFEDIEHIVNTGLVCHKDSLSEYTEEYSSSFVESSLDYDSDLYSGDSPESSALDEYCDLCLLMSSLESDKSHEETQELYDYSET